MSRGFDAGMSWLIPVTFALGLWGANWLLMWLARYPVQPVGIPPFLGWQGLLARNVESVGTRIAHSLTTRLASVEEVIQVMGPRRIAEHVAHSIRPRLAELVEDTVLECKPQLWDALDESCKRDIIVRMQRELPKAVQGFVFRITGNIGRYANLDLLTRRLLVEQPDKLISLISQMGDKELRFAINAGLYFGAPLGLLLAALWQFWPYPWLLPVAGFVGGILINALAVFLLFNPAQPVQVGPLRIQALFARRQEEASLVGCRIFARDMISIQNVMDAIMSGEHEEEVRQLVRAALRPVVHNALESRRDIIEAHISAEEFDVLDNLLVQRMAENTKVTFDDPVFNHERMVAVEQNFLDRLLELSSVEFQELLRPGIRDEESLFILGGGVACACVGGISYALLTLTS